MKPSTIDYSKWEKMVADISNSEDETERRESGEDDDFLDEDDEANRKVNDPIKEAKMEATLRKWTENPQFNQMFGLPESRQEKDKKIRKKKSKESADKKKISKKEERKKDPRYQLVPKELPMIVGYAPYLGRLNLLPDVAYQQPAESQGRVFEPSAHLKESLPEEDLPQYYCPSDDSDDDDNLFPHRGLLPNLNDGIGSDIARFALARIQEQTRTEPEIVRYYILHIRLCGIRPAIWRRVRVPSQLSLSMFHDKILCPVIGWCRNYHAYMFTLPTIMYARNRKPHPKHDIGFGPVRSQSVDMMHRLMKRGGSSLVDDTKVCLGDLLRHPGQYLKYVYDLGDMWHHKITLEAIFSDLKKGEIPFSVLDGSGGCPPEDCGSMYSYCEKLSILTDPKHAKFKENMESLFMAKNKIDVVREMMKMKEINFDCFNPYYFDIQTAQKALDTSLVSKVTSGIDDTKHIRWIMKEGKVTPQRFAKKAIHLLKVCSFCDSNEKVVKKQGKKLRLCSRCRHVHYCSLDCQKNDWNDHKRLCVSIENKPK